MIPIDGGIAALRGLLEEDRARLLVWRNSPDVSPYMYSEHRISEAEHNKWFDQIQTDARRAYWVIVSNSRPVGLANLYDIDRHNQRCSWAYYLADPLTRGKGIGTFVEYTMIEKAFKEFGIQKLWCEVLKSNETVWKLHQKFGFEIEARFRHHIVKDGHPLDVIGLGLLKEDWEKLREAIELRLAGIVQRYQRSYPESAE